MFDIYTTLQTASDPATAVEVLEHLAIHQHVEVRRSVAANPNTPWNILERLAGEFPEEFLCNAVCPIQLINNPQLITTHPKFWNKVLRVAEIPPIWLAWLNIHKELASIDGFCMHIQNAGEIEDWRELLSCDNKDIKELTIAHWPLPENVLIELARHEDREIRQIVAERKDLPVEILTELAQDSFWRVRRAIASNPDNEVNTLRQLARDDKKFVREVVAENPNTPIDVLLAFADDVHGDVRQIVAGHKETPVAVLCKLAKDHRWNVRARVGENEHTPIEIRKELAYDEDINVQTTLTTSKSIPLDLMREVCSNSVLCKDEHGHDYIEQALAENKEKSTDILYALARVANYEVREALAGNKETPTNILELLAHDPDFEVRIAVANNVHITEHILEILMQDTEIEMRQIIALHSCLSIQQRSVLQQDPDPNVRSRARIAEELWTQIEKAGIKIRDTPISIFNSTIEYLEWVKDLPVVQEIKEQLRELPIVSLNNLLNWYDEISIPMSNYSIIPIEYDVTLPILKRADAPRHILHEFAHSDEWQHRWLIALHKKTPPDVRANLCHDGNRYVRATAQYIQSLSNIGE